MTIEEFYTYCTVCAKDHTLDESRRELHRAVPPRLRDKQIQNAGEAIAELNKWATNLEAAAPRAMPPYCATLSEDASIYREMIAVLQQPYDTWWQAHLAQRTNYQRRVPGALSSHFLEEMTP